MARIRYQDQVYVLPDGEMDGDSLSEELSVPAGHDLILVRPEGNLLVSRSRKVRPVDDDYFVDAPTFEYGAATTHQQLEMRRRPGFRMQRIFQEALLLARQFGEVDYDEEEGCWVYIPNFGLPVGWDRPQTGLLLALPSSYPHIPPNGFYVDRFLRSSDGRRMDHYFEERSIHNPYADQGWGWFCIHLGQRSWRPTADTRYGDNLLKLTVLIRAILTEVVRA